MSGYVKQQYKYKSPKVKLTRLVQQLNKRIQRKNEIPFIIAFHKRKKVQDSITESEKR